MTTSNRIAEHLDAPNPTATPSERSRIWSDALFAAVAALQAQLSHPNAEVVREAATVLIDLEKTRLRHDRPLAGILESGPHTVGAGWERPHTPCADHSPDGPLPEMRELPDFPPGDELDSHPLANATSEEKHAYLDRMNALLDSLGADDEEEEEAEPVAAVPAPRAMLADRLHARLAARAVQPADSPA